MYNNCTFIGNLGKDPEVRASKGGASFTTFSVGVNKPGDKDAKTLWVNVTAFGKTGEFVAQYMKKGNQVLVEGPIELQEFEGSDGKSRTTLKQVANKVVSLSKREGTTEHSASAPASQAAPKASVADDDIPF